MKQLTPEDLEEIQEMKEIDEAFDRGEIKSVDNFEEVKAMIEDAAAHYVRKDARINIRVTRGDVIGLKMLAKEEGMPYQTLLASVIHKLVTGKIKLHGDND